MQLLCTLFLAVALHVVSGLSIPVKGGLLDSGQYITHFTNTWAVEVHGGQEAANGIAEKYGFVNLGQIGSLTNMYLFMIPDSDGYRRLKSIDTDLSDKTALLKSENMVGYVEQQKTSRMQKKYIQPSNATDPLWDIQWNVNNTGQTGESDILVDIKAEPAWIQGYTGMGITVGVVDDGLDHTHTDLMKNYAPQFSYDFVDNDTDPFPGNDTHGTACGGIISMTRDNDVCGVGVAYDSKVAGLRLLGDTGGTDAETASALSHSRSNIDIYSNSWGPSDFGFVVGGPSYLSKMAVKEGTEMGRGGRGNIYTFAAGNGGHLYDSCAADGTSQSIYTISVGAYSDDGSPAYYDEKCSAKQTVAYVESRNPDLKSVTLGINDQCTTSFDGTSAATPYVSAVIALTLQARPELTWRDIQYLIAYTSNADPLLNKTDDEFVNGAGLTVSHQFGFGAIDAEAMVTRAQHWTNVPPQIVDTITPSITSGNAAYNTPLDIAFNYSGQIRYLEHIVITLSVNPSGYLEYVNQLTAFLILFDDYFDDTLYPGRYDNRSKRGDINVTLMSPMGSESTLIFNRPYDTVTEGYDDWPTLSVLHWGEDPNGQWNVRIGWNNSIIGSAVLSNISVALYGVSSLPINSRIPSQCDSTCARSKGCAGPGPQYCDACNSSLLRNATTRECIEPLQCVPPYMIASGYCYSNISSPKPSFSSSVMPSTSSVMPSTSSVMPSTSSVMPSTSSVMPSTSSVMPSTSSEPSPTTTSTPSSGWEAGANSLLLFIALIVAITGLFF